MAADPRTIRVELDTGNSVQEYTLAPGLAQYVQSVYVEVDAAAASDTRPVLTWLEQSGVVIGKKRQGEAITGGTAGSATWALRLTDENGGGSGTTVQYAGYAVSNPDTPPQPQYTGWQLNDWALQAGIALLDTTTDPDNASVTKDGIYTWTFHPRYVIGLAPVDAFAAYTSTFFLQLSTIPGPLYCDVSVALPLASYTLGIYPQTTTCVRLPMHAGDALLSPFQIHNVPATHPNAADLRGADMEIQLLWEPLRSPFPVI